MKKCGYCGRENADKSDRCADCGTSLAQRTAEKPSPEARERPLIEWLWTSMRYAALPVLVALFYLLSFGPVDRYCGKVATIATTSTAYTTVTKVTVHYPLWVSLLYRPALYLKFRSEIYQLYIAWWNRGDNLNR